MMRVAFLDRDSTIVKDYADEHWTNIYKLEFLPNSLQGLKSIINKGYEIIIITNQYIIHEGYISYSRYKMLNDAMCVKLKDMGIDLLDIFMCPHARSQPCHCRKPETGMIEMAMQKYPSIDKTTSFIAGDSDCDEELAKRCRMQFYRINEAFDLFSVSEKLEYSETF